nr:MAG TPA: hypothetical protein [Caudoviricetes sp.]
MCGVLHIWPPGAKLISEKYVGYNGLKCSNVVLGR